MSKQLSKREREETEDAKSSSEEDSKTSKQGSSGPEAKRGRTEKRNYCKTCNKPFPDSWKFKRHIASIKHQLMLQGTTAYEPAKRVNLPAKIQTTPGKKKRKKRAKPRINSKQTPARIKPLQRIIFHCQLCRQSHPSRDILEQHLTSHRQFSGNQAKNQIFDWEPRMTRQASRLDTSDHKSYNQNHVSRLNRRNLSRCGTRRALTLPHPHKVDEKSNERTQNDNTDTNVERNPKRGDEGVEGEDRKEVGPTGEDQGSHEPEEGVDPRPPELVPADGTGGFDCFVCNNSFASSYHLNRHLGTFIHAQHVEARSMPQLFPDRMYEVLPSELPDAEKSEPKLLEVQVGTDEMTSVTRLTPQPPHDLPPVPSPINPAGIPEQGVEPVPQFEAPSTRSASDPISLLHEDVVSELQPSEDWALKHISPLPDHMSAVPSPEEAQGEPSRTRAQDVLYLTPVPEQLEDTIPTCPLPSSSTLEENERTTPRSPSHRTRPEKDVCPEKTPGQEERVHEENDIEVVFEDVRRPSTMKGAVINYGGKQYVVKRVITTKGTLGLPHCPPLTGQRWPSDFRRRQFVRPSPQSPTDMSMPGRGGVGGLEQPSYQEVIVLDDQDEAETPEPRAGAAETQSAATNKSSQGTDQGSAGSEDATHAEHVPVGEQEPSAAVICTDSCPASPKTPSQSFETHFGSVPNYISPVDGTEHSPELQLQAEGDEEAEQYVGKDGTVEDPGRLLFEEIQEFQDTADLHHAPVEAAASGEVVEIIPDNGLDANPEMEGSEEKTVREKGSIARATTSGANGPAMTDSFLEDAEPGKDETEDPLFCRVCQVRLTTPFNLRRHKKTQGHLGKLLASTTIIITNGEAKEESRLAGAGQSRTGKESKKPPLGLGKVAHTAASAAYACITCGGKAFHSAYNLDRHTATPLHQKRAQFDKLNPPPLNPTPDLSCRACALHFEHRYDLSLHLASKVHRRNASRLREVGSEAEKSSDSRSSSAYDSDTSDSSDFDSEQEERKIVRGLAALDLGDSDSSNSSSP